MKLNYAFLGGFVSCIVFLVCIGIIGVFSGFIPANANAKPSRFERTIAHISLNATIRRKAPQGAAPIAASPENLTEGVRLYGENCAVCHGTSAGKMTTIAQGLYQSPPQFAKDDVTDDPVGTIYWKIHNGIRLTGMPSFSASLTEKEQWQITLFLKHMNNLPVQTNAAWHRLAMNVRQH